MVKEGRSSKADFFSVMDVGNIASLLTSQNRGIGSNNHVRPELMDPTSRANYVHSFFVQNIMKKEYKPLLLVVSDCF